MSFLLDRESANRSARRTAAALATMGTLHFLKPEPFDSIIPPSFPGKPRTYTYLSGAAELGIAAMLTYPKTRKLGALSSIALYAAVFPANVQMAHMWRSKPPVMRALAYARLPMQLPLSYKAWRLYKSL